MALMNLVYLPLHIGADSGFDGICETQGACRGAVGLVKSRKTKRDRVEALPGVEALKLNQASLLVACPSAAGKRM